MDSTANHWLAIFVSLTSRGVGTTTVCMRWITVSGVDVHLWARLRSFASSQNEPPPDSASVTLLTLRQGRRRTSPSVAELEHTHEWAFDDPWASGGSDTLRRASGIWSD